MSRAQKGGTDQADNTLCVQFPNTLYCCSVWESTSYDDFVHTTCKSTAAVAFTDLFLAQIQNG